jgi:hypothetical protein
MFASLSLPFEIGACAGNVNRILRPIQVDFIHIGPNDHGMKLFLVPIYGLNGPAPVIGIPAASDLVANITG